MKLNKLVVASAGSGKTTYLVKQALSVPTHERVLVTTFTESNEAGIRAKFVELAGCVPANVTIDTWFSFLLTHGVKPFQSKIIGVDVRGLLLVNEQSGLKFRAGGRPFYWPENEPHRYYLSKEQKVYSDKLAKLVVKLNAANEGAVLLRLSRIYRHVFIDEVQDMAGYDLDVIALLMGSSSTVIAVGDPRQVTYLTHWETRLKKYREGAIVEYFKKGLPKKVKCEVDDTSLKVSHRNNASICELSSKVYPALPASAPCTCCREKGGHEGLFVVGTLDVDPYLAMTGAMQLRHSSATQVSQLHEVMTFGACKGLGYEHVLIFPTKDQVAWFKDPAAELKAQGRSRLYVALTRARKSVGVVVDLPDNYVFEGFTKFQT